MSAALILVTIPDGAARIGATLFSELLNAVFASIGQHAVRKVARETFEHLLNLDLKFHLSRQTGGLTRAIDRGTKCAVPPLLPQYHNADPPSGESRSFYNPYYSELPQPHLRFHWFVGYWYAAL
jgi:hypothetical protein